MAVSALTTFAQIKRRQRVTKLRDNLAQQLRSLGFRITGATNRTSPGHLHIRKTSLSADILLTALDMSGVAASAGSACSAGSIVASPVLRGMGWTPRQATEAIRISLGRATKAVDMDVVIAVLRRLSATSSSSARSKQEARI